MYFLRRGLGGSQEFQFSARGAAAFLLSFTPAQEKAGSNQETVHGGIFPFTSASREYKGAWMTIQRESFLCDKYLQSELEGYAVMSSTVHHVMLPTWAGGRNCAGRNSLL